MVKYNICIYGIGLVGDIFISQLKDNSDAHILFLIHNHSVANLPPSAKHIEQDTFIPDHNLKINMTIINEPKYCTLDIIKLNLNRRRNILVSQHNTRLSSNDISEIYDLASEKNLKLYFISHTKYFLNQKITKSIKNGNIGKLYSTIAIASYIQKHNNMLDLCTHNLIYNNNIIKEKPISVYTHHTVNGNYNFLNILFTYPNNTSSYLYVSSGSPNNEQSYIYNGEYKCLKDSNQISHNISDNHTIYKNILSEFMYKYTPEHNNNNFEDYLHIISIINAIKASINTKNIEHISYNDMSNCAYFITKKIKQSYLLCRKIHTIKFIEKLKNIHLTYDTTLNIWEIFKKLDEFKDITQTNDKTFLCRAIQTAECIRKKGHPDWLQMVGLIHELGKIIFIKGSEKYGTNLNCQWGITCNSFILGCLIPKTAIYPSYNCMNSDMQNKEYNTKNGIYEKKCGLDNTISSWNHGEYLYHILVYNKCTLPPEALHIIRYQLLALYHEKNEYFQFQSDTDIEYLKWIKLFSKYKDMSKNYTIYNLEELKEYYSTLFDKYFHKQELVI